MADLSERVEEEEATNEKLSAEKKKLDKQCEELKHDVEDLESNVSRLEKDKQVGLMWNLVHVFIIPEQYFVRTSLFP